MFPTSISKHESHAEDDGETTGRRKEDEREGRRKGNERETKGRRTGGERETNWRRTGIIMYATMRCVVWRRTET
eukprot:7455808-Alexandrium_andersonii.AAC.1